MGSVNSRTKAVVVPFAALGLWLFPGAGPDVVVAGSVEFPVTAVVESDGGSVGPPTSVAPESSVLESLPDASPATAAPAESVSSLPAITQPAPTASAATSPSAAASPAPTTESPELPEPVLAPTSAALPVGEQALALVSFDWQERFPNWQVEFRGERDGFRALTYPAERRIEVFIRPSDTPETLHRVFAHELGHVIDVELNSDEDRERWLATRGIDRDAPWWPSASSPDFDTGAGDFAEAFAVWETGVSSRSTIGRQPDIADLELLRELAVG